MGTLVDLFADYRFAVYFGFALFGAILFLVHFVQFVKAKPTAPEGVDLNLPSTNPSTPQVATASVAASLSGPGSVPPPVKSGVNTTLVTPPPPISPPPTPLAAEKTMVLSTPPPVLLPVSSSAVPEQSTTVDLHMYETLVRRIGALEGELKKDPLYLDPLLKRVSHLEKEIAALSEKMGAIPAQGVAAASPSEPAGGAVDGEEFLALKEKVYGLQKILEHLAEGSVPPGIP